MKKISLGERDNVSPILKALNEADEQFFEEHFKIDWEATLPFQVSDYFKGKKLFFDTSKEELTMEDPGPFKGILLIGGKNQVYPDGREPWKSYLLKQFKSIYVQELSLFDLTLSEVVSFYEYLIVNRTYTLGDVPEVFRGKVLAHLLSRSVKFVALYKTLYKTKSQDNEKILKEFNAYLMKSVDEIFDYGKVDERYREVKGEVTNSLVSGYLYHLKNLKDYNPELAQEFIQSTFQTPSVKLWVENNQENIFHRGYLNPTSWESRRRRAILEALGGMTTYYGLIETCHELAELLMFDLPSVNESYDNILNSGSKPTLYDFRLKLYHHFSKYPTFFRMLRYSKWWLHSTRKFVFTRY